MWNSGVGYAASAVDNGVRGRDRASWGQKHTALCGGAAGRSPYRRSTGSYTQRWLLGCLLGLLAERRERRVTEAVYSIGRVRTARE